MKHWKPILFFAVVFLLLYLLGQYAYEAVTRRPQVDVKGAELRVDETVTVLGVVVPKKATVIVELEVTNPNIIPIKLAGGSYDLYINDVAVGTGSVPEDVQIPAESKGTADTQVRLDTLSGLEGVIQSLGDGRLKVKVVGDAMLDVPLMGVQEIPFHEEREITL